VSKRIDEVGPLNLTEHDFSISVSDKAVKSSEHEAIERQMQLIIAWHERAACIVDDVE
jgi:hypothetical protein